MCSTGGRMGEANTRVALQAGRCSHVFGLLARHTRPLAIMPSTDQVPVKSPHSTVQWHMWVVLIAGSTGGGSRASDARSPFGYRGRARDPTDLEGNEECSAERRVQIPETIGISCGVL
jgi:hypothetical protein